MKHTAVACRTSVITNALKTTAMIYKIAACCGLILTSLTFSSYQSTQELTFQQLTALNGAWKMVTPTETILEEWRQSPTGMMVGRSYRVKGTDTTLLESIVLKQDTKGIYYIPTTEDKNKHTVTFTLNKRDQNRFVFENKKHDFPQRIIYNLISRDSIAARIEGTVKGKTQSQDFFYKRVKQ